MSIGHIPKGYKIENGQVVVDPLWQPIIKKIFDDFCIGEPQYKIAEHFNLSPNTIGDILKRQDYLGEGKYPQIIDNKIFEQAQEIRKMRARKLSRDNLYSSHKVREQYVFSDKIFCGECGEKFKKYKRRVGRARNSKIVWECFHHIKEGRIACQNTDVTDEQLEHSFIIVMNRLLKNPSLMAKSNKCIEKKESARYRAINREIMKAESHETEYDTNEMVRMILHRASLKYDDTDTDFYLYYTDKIKRILFEVKDPLSFNEEVFKGIVDRVIVYKDKRLRYILQNGAEIEDCIR